MISEKELQAIEKELNEISPFPWRCEKTTPGEWWITAPDDSDHEFREDFEPIFESSGTPPQFGVDGNFIAKSPEIIERLVKEIRNLRTRQWGGEMIIKKQNPPKPHTPT